MISSQTSNVSQRKRHRQARRRAKRKFQGSLLILALILSISIYSCQWFAGIMTSNDDQSNHSSRVLLQSRSDDDGYYINSLSEFPNLAFSLSEIRNGAWILYLFGMFYCFVGIAIVCDDYFCVAIEVIVDRLKLSEDVAGATFLAAGGSAPELFTSFVGTFIAESDVGFGTIVGSAVFNVLFIVGACALSTPGNLRLQWYPFARDMSYYLLCLAVLSLFFGGVSRNQMYWWESLILLSMYIFYVFIMSRNAKLKAFIYRILAIPEKDTVKLLDHQSNGYGTESTEISMQKQTATPNMSMTKSAKSSAASTVPDAIVEEQDVFDGDDTKNDDDDDDDNESDSDSEEGPDLTFPETTGARIWYLIQAPLSYPIYYTLFDVSKEENAPWWPWTFVGSLIWLGALAYFMVWWAVVVGYAWRVPQEIMGLVFLAAGTSVPELFSCIYVAKKGMADMAVSASIGSNIFDVLVGLPLPWLSYAIIQGEATGELVIDVQAHGLFLSILVLILILVGLMGILSYNKWYLNNRAGISMIALYGLFVGQDLIRYYWLDVEF